MIRLCSNADTDEILEIINDGARAYEGVIPDDRWHDPYMSRDHLLSEIAAGVIFWGHETEGQLAGIMAFSRSRTSISFGTLISKQPTREPG